MSNGQQHDPSNPNDPRNWNGHTGPTFTAVNPFDVDKKPVLYSSFSLLPIPLHSLPGSARTTSAVEPVPTEELEQQILQLEGIRSYPSRLRANPIFQGLIENVLSQNPDQRQSHRQPTPAQLLAELRRQNVLTSFHSRHLQLLAELTPHLANGGSAFEPFTFHPELSQAAEEISALMRRNNPRATSDEVHEEIALRVREGQSKNPVDHNIHQLQNLLSQILQQIQRENEGDFTVPEELSGNPLYQQVQHVLENTSIMATHIAMRDDLERRIKDLRATRERELRLGSLAPPYILESRNLTSEQTPRKTRPSFMHVGTGTPEDIPQSPPPPRIRDDVIKYNMAPKAGAGLPVGFALDPQWTGNNIGFGNKNNPDLRYYVNDGPRGPHESEAQYKHRIVRAVENMEIEHRVLPVLSQAEAAQYTNKAALAKARKDFEYKALRDATSHFHKLKLKGRYSNYDADYDEKWKAEKRARQARNAVRRRQAQETLRAELLARPETFGMRLPTPPPPDDSGDELYDYTSTHGPKTAMPGRNRREKTVTVPDSFSHENSPSRLKPNAVPKCAACKSASAPCSIADTGRPCQRCTANGIECRDKALRAFEFINTHGSANPIRNKRVAIGRNGGYIDNELEPSFSPAPWVQQDRWRSSAARSSFGRLPGRSRRRDSRSRSPAGLFEPDVNMTTEDDWTPCDNCFVNGRACDNDGPPCRDCNLLGLGGACNSSGSASKPYNAVPPAMQYDPAQLNLVPDTGAPNNDPWARMNNMLRDGANLSSGNGRSNSYQVVNPPDPQTSFDWSEVDELLNFTSDKTPKANPSAEMAAQSATWATKENPVWSGGAQYNAFGQELDMHGNVVPGGRIFDGTIDQDPDQPVSSVTKNYLNDNPFNRDTETGLGERDNFAGPNHIPPGYSFVEDLEDTAMGGTNDQPLNPNLPNDDFSLGQDPAQQPDFTLSDGPVLPDIAPESLEKSAALNRGPCDEFIGIFTEDPWTGARCGKAPTKSCDHTGHSSHHICISCHSDQNASFLPAQTEAINATKRWMCAPCADTALKMWAANVPINADLRPDEGILAGMCTCARQLRKSWLCHTHRDAAITRVRTRTALMQDIIIRMSGDGTVKCAFCLEREQDPSTAAWACVACYRYVISGGLGVGRAEEYSP